jgi:hypothetical protein
MFCSAVILYIYKKQYRQLSTLIAGSIFGVFLEFMNVFLTEGYTYSQHFLIQVGSAPHNIPIVIGLSWGILLVTSHQISDCYELPPFVKLLFESAFVVSVDLFLDVIAVRLDGGFWIWTNAPLDLNITALTLYGIFYGNFYGWYCVIFSISLILRIFDWKFEKRELKFLIIRTVVAIIGAEILLLGCLYGAMLSIPFKFIWILFLFLYGGSIVVVSIYFIKKRANSKQKIQNIFPFLYYLFSYGFSIIAMIALSLITEIPLFFSLNVVFGIGSAILILKNTQLKSKKKRNLHFKMLLQD